MIAALVWIGRRANPRRTFEHLTLESPHAPRRMGLPSIPLFSPGKKPKQRRLPVLALPPPGSAIPNLGAAGEPAPATRRRTLAPTIRIDVAPFRVGADDIPSHAAARRLATKLIVALPAIAPEISVGRASEEPRSVLPAYLLEADVRHLGDRLRVRASLTERVSAEPVFHLRYQALPSEEDKILAEIVAQIVRLPQLRSSGFASGNAMR